MTIPRRTRAKQDTHCEWCAEPIKQDEECFVYFTYPQSYDQLFHRECMAGYQVWYSVFGAKNRNIYEISSGNFRRGCFCDRRVKGDCQCKSETRHRIAAWELRLEAFDEW